VTVENLIVGFPATVERTGTWEDPGDQPTLEIYGDWIDTTGALNGIDIRLDHAMTATDSGFQVTVLDELTDPVLRAKACRTGVAGRACIHRENIDPGDPIAIGRLPQHMIVGARLGSGRLEMFVDREVSSGAVTALLIDETLPFERVPIWKGWSPTGALRVSTEWIGTVPPLEFLTFIPTVQEDIEFDFATDFSPSNKPDGWIEVRPIASEVAEGS
jgi:hypothetical protein